MPIGLLVDQAYTGHDVFGKDTPVMNSAVYLFRQQGGRRISELARDAALLVEDRSRIWISRSDAAGGAGGGSGMVVGASRLKEKKAGSSAKLHA
jgi:hypothetical protein